MEFTLLFAVLTAGAAMYVATRLTRRRLTSVEGPIDTLMGAAVIGLVAGRVAAMLGDGVNPITNPFEVILVRAGVETAVAAPVALLALGWLWRRHLPGWVDAVAPVAVAGLAGWHGGCVWRGTCLGTASDLPWAFGLPGSTVTRHPVELYAMLGLVIVAVMVALLPARPWLSTGVAIAGAGLVRLVTEPVRPSLFGGPTTFYVVAVTVGVIIVVLGPRFGRLDPSAGDRPADVTDRP